MFLLHMFKLNDSFLSCAQSKNESIMSKQYSCLLWCSWFLAIPFAYFLDFLSVCIHYHMFLHIVYFFSIKSLTILIVVLLISWCGISGLSTVCVSASDAFFFFYLLRLYFFLPLSLPCNFVSKPDVTHQIIATLVIRILV